MNVSYSVEVWALVMKFVAAGFLVGLGLGIMMAASPGERKPWLRFHTEALLIGIVMAICGIPMFWNATESMGKFRIAVIPTPPQAEK